MLSHSPGYVSPSSTGSSRSGRSAESKSGTRAASLPPETPANVGSPLLARSYTKTEVSAVIAGWTAMPPMLPA